jgi:hypothetical protein
MNHRVSRTTAYAAALGLATAMAAGPALADDEHEYEHQAPPPPVQPEGQQHLDTAHLTDAKLEQFVDALTEVHVIRNEAASELEAATDMETAQEVQLRAQQQMIDAVEEAGLSVEEYNQIATLMSTDPELQERISSKLEDRS